RWEACLRRWSPAGIRTGAPSPTARLPTNTPRGRPRRAITPSPLAPQRSAAPLTRRGRNTLHRVTGAGRQRLVVVILVAVVVDEEPAVVGEPGEGGVVGVSRKVPWALAPLSVAALTT